MNAYSAVESLIKTMVGCLLHTGTKAKGFGYARAGVNVKMRDMKNPWHTKAACDFRELMHKRLKDGDLTAMEWLKTERELRLKKVIALMTIIIMAFALAGCGMSRSEAADWANEFCASHGGVNTKSQNGFYFSDNSQGETNVTCADGTVGAREG